MKTDKKSVLGLSLITAIMLGTNAYAGLLKTDAGDPANPVVTIGHQYGFEGWNLSNVTPRITDVNYTNPIDGSFDKATGNYDPSLLEGKSFETDIHYSDTNTTVMAHLHGKDWPVGEPAGIKIINGDTKVQHGKPQNCILNSSYIEGTYLDSATPKPVICSSDFQTHKRFKVNMLPESVKTIDADRYGLPIELTFNLAEDTTSQRYQVLQKINNYTGLRLDGYKIEVLDENKAVDENLTISLGLGEGDNGDIWGPDELANFSHGLWGPVDEPHFPVAGFFDTARAAFLVSGHNSSTIVGGPETSNSNYESLFGLWLPSKWQPTGIFWDFDNDPTTDADLVAFWGTAPTDPTGTAPAWHKGIADNWAAPTDTEFLQWSTDDAYSEEGVEDTLNLGLNYIVNIGANIGSTFTIRITPRVAADQSPPSYIDGSGNPIPPVRPTITDGTVAISPAPTFIIGDILILSVKDEDQNSNPAAKDTTTVTVTTDTGDKETVTLTETDVNSAIFTSSIPSELTTTSPAVGDGKINVIKDAEVKVTYVDNTHNTEATTIATIPTDDTVDALDSSGNTASSGGGGCTSNPNGGFDMMFLLLAALGALYPFRRKLFATQA